MRPLEEHDPWQLARFLDAQANTWAQALAELQAGRKRSHWMWFIFPQLAGLGQSAMAQRYAIRSLDEAAAYLHEPVLGKRLRTATAAVLAVPDCPVAAIFGYPDDLKFHSSMTLFAAAARHTAQPAAPFSEALDTCFGGASDTATLALLRQAGR